MAKILRALLLGLSALGLGLGLGLGATPALGDVQDFSYDSWHVDFRVDADAEGRAVARVTETIVARFPDFDQNRGIVRGIPIDYQGASTHPRDFSVTNGGGIPIFFEIERDDGFVAVLVGGDDYVHGAQRYVIEYTLSDVVLAREDGAADELYWDLMDFEHAQPVGAFSATVEFAGALSQSPNGDARCYAGWSGSTAECGISPDAASASILRIAPLPLAPYQGVTAAIGLEPGSVVQPPVRLPNFALDVVPLYLGGAGLAAAVSGGVVVGRMRRRRRTARGAIVAQYEVPGSLPPLLAGSIVAAPANPVPAQIVHLAVNGAIRIEETEPEQGLLSPKKPRPVLRLLDPRLTADPLDDETVSKLFGSKQAGDALTIPKKSEKFAKKMQKLREAGAKAADRRGYFEKAHSPAARVLGFVSIGVLAVLLPFVVIGAVQRNSPTSVIALIAGVIALFIAIASIVRHRVHTPQGAEALEHLEGVREFIRVAEADRLRVLQSYTGAERDGDVIRVYERLLPYAMLFGLEKEWSKVLQTKYAEQSAGFAPAWYPLATFRGLDGVGSTLSQFTNSLTSSVSYTSSSSGGSSGGGFAGGGGGGGFSGGR